MISHASLEAADGSVTLSASLGEQCRYFPGLKGGVIGAINELYNEVRKPALFVLHGAVLYRAQALQLPVPGPQLTVSLARQPFMRLAVRICAYAVSLTSSPTHCNQQLTKLFFAPFGLSRQIDNVAVVCQRAQEHIHAGECILTYGYSRIVEQFLKAAGAKRKFQV